MSALEIGLAILVVILVVLLALALGANDDLIGRNRRLRALCNIWRRALRQREDECTRLRARVARLEFEAALHDCPRGRPWPQHQVTLQIRGNQLVALVRERKR